MYCNNSVLNCTMPNETRDLTDVASEWKPPDFDPSVKNVILAILLTSIDVVTTLGNLLVLLSFVIEKRLLQPFNLFILNLAITDFLVAITAMTFYTIDTLLGYWPFGYIMCGLWIYFDFAMTFASVFTLTAISIDRFWCVTWAIHYRMHNSRTRTAMILGIIWFCVIAIWTPPFIGDRLKHTEGHYCIWEPSDNREFVLFVAVIGHYVPCILMVFCYFKVFYAMKQKTTRVTNEQTIGSDSKTVHIHGTAEPKRTQSERDDAQIVYSVGTQKSDFGASSQYMSTTSSQVVSTTNTNSNDSGRCSPPSALTAGVLDTRTNQLQYRLSQNHIRERKIFVTLTYVLSSYLIFWFPFYIAFDTYAWRPELVPGELYTFFFWMTYVNSMFNPFIYAYTSKEFRSAFIKVLRCLYRCRT